MQTIVLSHAGGLECVPKLMISEVREAVIDVNLRPQRGTASRIRSEIILRLTRSGWSAEVPLAVGSDITITSVKSSTGLCLQTGNVARVYADLIKLQTLYCDGSIASAIFLIPTSQAAMAMGSNIANVGRLEKELRIFRKVINLPIVIIAFE